MPMQKQHVMFDGPIPGVEEGDVVECRTASGGWIQMVATGSARYDDANAIGMKTYLTIPVAPVEAWEKRGPRVRSVNWPAEDVRTV